MIQNLFFSTTVRTQIVRSPIMAEIFHFRRAAVAEKTRSFCRGAVFSNGKTRTVKLCQKISDIISLRPIRDAPVVFMLRARTAYPTPPPVQWLQRASRPRRRDPAERGHRGRVSTASNRFPAKPVPPPVLMPYSVPLSSPIYSVSSATIGETRLFSARENVQRASPESASVATTSSPCVPNTVPSATAR